MSKNRCPVCMTKMKIHPDGHTLLCPECGYKLCDHSYTDRDLFSEEHYHSDYVTYSKPSQTMAQGSRSSAYQKNTRQKGKKKRFGWELYFFIILIILYLLMQIQE